MLGEGAREQLKASLFWVAVQDTSERNKALAVLMGKYRLNTEKNKFHFLKKSQFQH